MGTTGQGLGRKLSEECTNGFHEQCARKERNCVKKTCTCLCHDERAHRTRPKRDKSPQMDMSEFGTIEV